jgi:hypothetical protein
MDTIAEMRKALDGGNEPSPNLDDSALKVDDPIPGQSFCCMSFINPEDVIVRKDQWKFYKYHQHVIKTYHEIFTTLTDKMLEKDEITPADVVDVQERMGRVFTANETGYDSWSNLIKDYEFKNGDADDSEFDAQNNFQTSVRGVKVRGTYSTLKEARVRAAVLQKIDPRFHIFVLPVGYWCPSNPDPNKLSLKDQEYSNNELNTLMKSYHENEVKKDMFYEEQTRQRIKEEKEQTTRIRNEQEKATQKMKKVIEEVSTDSIDGLEITDASDLKTDTTLQNDNKPQYQTELAENTMESDDLWLRRQNTENTL